MTGSKILDYLVARMAEASSWRAIILGALAGLGIQHVDANLVTAILGVLAAVGTLMGVLMPEKTQLPPQQVATTTQEPDEQIHTASHYPPF